MKKIVIALLFVLPLALVGQSYKKLHNKAILVDTHNDIPSATIEKNVKFDSDLKGKTHSDLQRMKEGGIDVQIFSIFCGPEQATPYAFANREIDSVYEWTRRNPDKMMIVKNPEQLQQAIKEKKLAAMMGVEGGHMIEDKIENLDKLYERGVRYMTLTWNNSTSWATSAKDETEKKDSLPHKGLTGFGKQVVKRMNELGMIVDISHVGEQTFWDAINTTTKPIIASHSCVWNLCPHRRNLKDEQIKAIGKNGGVIHLNFYAGFIDSTYEKKLNEFKARYKKEIDELIANKTQPDYAAMMVAEKHKDEMGSLRPPLSLLMDHLDYIVRLIGVDHVGMGSDFDGIEAPPRELNGVEDYPLITKALLERGYSKKDIKKMLGGNFLRVFKAVQSH
ncbi:MAG: membrane dipeptidase [Sphingobacteriales bacterium]|nr:MAG: membrane dipeptidase [Sphingobacteriales bacterium]